MMILKIRVSIQLISQMMIFINECYKAEHVYKEYAENFIKMLSCIAPHICEEMWQ